MAEIPKQPVDRAKPNPRRGDGPRKGVCRRTVTCPDCGDVREVFAARDVVKCRRCAVKPRRTGEMVECPTCGRERYFAKQAIEDGHRYCSYACAKKDGFHKHYKDPAAMRRKISASKVGHKNPNYKNGNKSQRWHGSKESRCRICGGTNRLTLHHVVYEQHVRKAGGDCWDPDNGFTVCFACHMRHHQGMDHRIPIAKLRPENIAFASALLGAWVDDYFARYYDQRTGKEPWLDEGSSLAA